MGRFLLPGIPNFGADIRAPKRYFLLMSKAEIVAELPKLTPAERDEVRLKLAEMDGQDWLDEDDPLTESEKALLEARFAAHEADPATAIPWAEYQERLRRRLGE